MKKTINFFNERYAASGMIVIQYEAKILLKHTNNK
jgi:hypothetical protein